MRSTSARIATKLGLAWLALVITQCSSYDPQLLDPAKGPKWSDGGASALCGNGVVDANEHCDTAIAAGEAGACPSECETLDMCEPNLLIGENCNVLCKTARITTARNRDGCCPPGIGAAEDSDCGFCGDGIRGPDETCDPPETCPTENECTLTNACIYGRYVGSASECTAACLGGVVTECTVGDLCCPTGCSAETDGDCSNSCHNGVVEPEKGETCEPNSSTDPCEASCDDGIPCTEDLYAGSPGNCNVSCGHVPVVLPIPGDGCCAPNANALSDTDCIPVCGNGVSEPPETCDPCDADCDDHNPCTLDSFTGSAAACDLLCSHSAVTAWEAGDGCCPSGASSLDDADCDAECGNGLLETGEECDGEAYCSGACERVLHASIVHRYRFDGTGTVVTDSAGTAHGTLINATLDGDGKVSLPGPMESGTDAYVDLPDGIISSLTDASFEAWFTWTNTTTDHTRIFDFGSNAAGEDLQGDSSVGYLYLTGGLDTSRHPRTSFYYATTLRVSADTEQVGASGVHHLAVVFNDSGNALVLYLDGVRIASGALDGTNGHLSKLNDNNNWLGRSQFAHDPEFAGAFYEFRIYSAVLSDSDIANSYAAGPDP